MNRRGSFSIKAQWQEWVDYLNEKSMKEDNSKWTKKIRPIVFIKEEPS